MNYDPDIFGSSPSGSSAGFDSSIFSSKGAVTDKPKEVAAPVDNFSGNLRFATPLGTLDTKIPLPQFINKGLAQFGSGIADYGMVTAKPGAVDEKRAIDNPLTKGVAGTVLGFAGKAAPAMALPIVGGPVVGGITAGAAMGALEPVGTGESRQGNTLIGAGLGAVLPGGVGLFRKMAQPTNAPLLKAAQAADIPVGLADITNSKLVKGVRSVLNDVPFIGGIGESQRNATQQGFNRAVGRTFGADAPSLTPDVVQTAKTNIKGELNRVWENNTLKLDPQLIQDINRISQNAADKLNPEQSAMVEKQIQNLLKKSNNAEIPGGFTNNWQSELRMAADGEKGLAQNTLTDLRKSVIGAFNRGVSGDDAAALTKARTQYGAFKTVEPLLNSAEAGVAGRVAGDVPAALLPNRVVQQYGSSGRSPFGDLPQIGSQFIVNRTPQTGGSPRAFVQNALVGTGLAGGLGATGGLLAGIGPVVGAAAGLTGAAGLQGLLGSPAVVKALYGNPAAVRGFLDAPEMKKMLLELSKNSAARLPPALAIGSVTAPALE